MSETEETTDVIFRHWEGDVVALFPKEPVDKYGHHCLSYQHVGQHGSCNPGGIIRRSRPATPEEYADLKTELEGLTYRLRVVQRLSRAANKIRRTRSFDDWTNPEDTNRPTGQKEN